MFLTVIKNTIKKNNPFFFGLGSNEEKQPAMPRASLPHSITKTKTARKFARKTVKKITELSPTFFKDGNHSLDELYEFFLTLKFITNDFNLKRHNDLLVFQNPLLHDSHFSPLLSELGLNNDYQKISSVYVRSSLRNLLASAINTLVLRVNYLFTRSKILKKLKDVQVVAIHGANADLDRISNILNKRPNAQRVLLLGKNESSSRNAHNQKGQHGTNFYIPWHHGLHNSFLATQDDKKELRVWKKTVRQSLKILSEPDRVFIKQHISRLTHLKRIQHELEYIVSMSNTNTIIGTFEKSPIGKIVTDYSEKWEIESICFQHGLVGQFSVSDLVLFDEYHAWDDISLASLHSDGYPKKAKVIIAGNHLWERYKLAHINSQGKIFTIGAVLQPFDHMNEFSDFIQIINSLISLEKNSQFVIRLHPKQDVEKFKRLIPQETSSRVVIHSASDVPLESFFEEVNLCIGLTSTALVDSQRAGCPSFSWSTPSLSGYLEIKDYPIHFLTPHIDKAIEEIRQFVRIRERTL